MNKTRYTRPARVTDLLSYDDYPWHEPAQRAVLSRQLCSRHYGGLSGVLDNPAAV